MPFSTPRPPADLAVHLSAWLPLLVRVLSHHLDPGEVRKIRESLPEDDGVFDLSNLDGGIQMSLFEILADEETTQKLGAAMIVLTHDEGGRHARNGIILTRELVDDAFGGDRDRATEVIRSGVIDHEALRRIDSPDRLIYQTLGAANALVRWHLATFSRDDLGLFEGPVRSR